MVRSMPPDQQALWRANAATTNTPAASTASPPPPAAAPPPGDVSLLTLVTNFVNLPTTIGNITVLSSSIVTNGAIIDPALMARIAAITAGVPTVPAPAPPGMGPVPNVGPATPGTTPGGLPGAPGSSPAPGDSKSYGVLIGAIVGAVAGCAIVAAAIAAYVIKKRRTEAYKPAGHRITPEPSETGAAPPRLESVIDKARSSWAQLRVSSGGAVAPEPMPAAAKVAPLPSPLGSTPSSPGTPIKAGIGSKDSLPPTPQGDSPRIFAPRPGSPMVSAPGYAPPPMTAGAAPVAPVGMPPLPPLADTAARRQLYAFPAVAPENWQTAARGRANLPALRQGENGEWVMPSNGAPMGHNVIVAGITTANIPEVGGEPGGHRPAGLPGAISLAGPDAAAAARDAVNGNNGQK